jgi:hypothetical protein
LRNSNTAGYPDIGFQYGAAGANWVPVAGDWTGQGITHVGLYDHANADFYLKNSFSGGAADLTCNYGSAGNSWTPLVGAWGNAASALPNPPQPGVVGGTSASTAASGGLTEGELASVVDAAIARWAADGISSNAVQRMEGADFTIDDLSGGSLANAYGDHITIDRDAAGFGWFVDDDPSSDSAFQLSKTDGQLHAVSPIAVDRVDLLTVVERELGQINGLGTLPATSNDIMSSQVPVGIRRDPSATDGAMLQYSL